MRVEKMMNKKIPKINYFWYGFIQGSILALIICGLYGILWSMIFHTILWVPIAAFLYLLFGCIAWHCLRQKVLNVRPEERSILEKIW